MEAVSRDRRRRRRRRRRRVVVVVVATSWDHLDRAIAIAKGDSGREERDPGATFSRTEYLTRRIFLHAGKTRRRRAAVEHPRRSNYCEGLATLGVDRKFGRTIKRPGPGTLFVKGTAEKTSHRDGIYLRFRGPPARKGRRDDSFAAELIFGIYRSELPFAGCRLRESAIARIKKPSLRRGCARKAPTTVLNWKVRLITPR